MSDSRGHSWVGLNPRTCRNCGAIEGSKAVWEPCSIMDRLRIAEKQAADLRHLSITLSEQLEHAENERERARDGWERTKWAAEERVEALEAILAEVETFFDSLPVQTKAKWDLGQILAKRKAPSVERAGLPGATA